MGGSVDGTKNGEKRGNGIYRNKTEEKVVLMCIVLRDSKKYSLQNNTLQIILKSLKFTLHYQNFYH